MQQRHGAKPHTETSPLHDNILAKFCQLANLEWTYNDQISERVLKFSNFKCSYFINVSFKMRWSTLTYNLVSTQTRLIVLKWVNASFSKNGPFPASFFFNFVFSKQLTVNVQYKFLPVTGFEPRTSLIMFYFQKKSVQPKVNLLN